MNRYVCAAMLGATMLAAGSGVPALAQQPGPLAGSAVGGPPPPPGGAMRGGGLMRADANGDGVVTREEVIADADRRFAALDSDGNGKLGREEMRAARRGPPPPGMDRAPPPPPPGMRDAAPPPPPGADRGDRPHRGMKRAQTREEARARALRLFDRADTNGDGRVDRQEMEAMRLLMRARRVGPDDRGDRTAPPPRPMPGDEQP